MNSNKIKTVFCMVVTAAFVGGCSAQEIGREIGREIGQTLYNSGKQVCEQSGNCDMRDEDKKVSIKF